MMLDSYNQRAAVEVRELLLLIESDDQRTRRCARVGELLDELSRRLTGHACDPADVRRVCLDGPGALSDLLRRYQAEQLHGFEQSLRAPRPQPNKPATE